MYVKVTETSHTDAGNIVTNCPICGKGETFDKYTNLPDLHVPTPNGGWYRFGQRKCPNNKCNAHIFIVTSDDGTIITYPSLKIDFNSENIPDAIKATLEEAITCHSEQCFMAAAIMVRRTLEELCENKNCQGKTLKKRIEALKSNVVLPNELFDALDELRLLGNDAAHIESKEYDKIGKEEVGIAIELTKEILKSVYQMDSLVKRLKDLKKSVAKQRQKS